MTVIICLAIVIIVVLIVASVYICKEKTKGKINISFKQAMELSELPIITFYQGQQKLNMLIDTGSNASYIDEKVLKSLHHTPLDNTSNVIMATVKQESASMAELSLVCDGVVIKGEFVVMDFSDSFGAIKRESGVQLHGILGTNICSKYKYIIDFHKYLISSK